MLEIDIVPTLSNNMTDNNEMETMKEIVNEPDAASSDILIKDLNESNLSETIKEQSVSIDEISKSELLPNTEETENDTNALLKQLDDALDETKKSHEDPVKDLSKEVDSLEKDDADKENSNLDFSADDIDALEIIDEIDDNEEEKCSEEVLKVDTEGDESANDSKDIRSENKNESKDVDAEMDDSVKESEVTEVNQSATESSITAEKPVEETILLESDDEKEGEQTVISKTNSNKRAIADHEKPPAKRTRSESPENKLSTNSEADKKSDDELVVINDADEETEKCEPIPTDGLLEIAGGNRRRSDAENESPSESDQTTKREASPLLEDDSSDTKRSKLSIDETSDSNSNQMEQEVKSAEEDLKQENTVKDEVKEAVKLTEPLDVQNVELKPKPEEISETEKKECPLSIDFLKSFKKTFELMNRQDLEEFVLQKVVEAIVNKSEASELRRKNEANEKSIANQRQRINDLAKQFRDLEMVHNRLVKDLETKSSGLVTPVKITRAVGLQVSQSRPKTDFRPMYPQANARVPPFPSRSPQRATPTSNFNALQNAQRMNLSLRERQSINSQFGPTKVSPMRGQISQSPQAKMIAMQKQQAMQRQQNLIQQQRVQAQAAQRQSSVSPNARSPLAIASPGSQRSPAMLNQLMNNPQGSPVVLRKIIRPGPASVQQAMMQQQQKSGQKQFIDLTVDGDAAARNPSNVTTATKIHVKTPATLNSSVLAPNISNGINRSVNGLNTSTGIQRLPGNNKFAVQISQKANLGNAQIIRRPIVTPNNQKRVHPAPLPVMPNKVQNAAWKRPPPRPQIRINNIDAGIVISWTIHEQRLAEDFDQIVKYQIYAYQETNAPPATESWRHVGDVKAMALPMAVTLTQFQEGQRYHFAVRAVDCHDRAGTFSIPRTWDEKN